MRSHIILIFIIGLFLIFAGLIDANQKTNVTDIGSKTVKIYAFHGQGCPHCAKQNSWLDKISNENSNIQIKKYEVYHNQSNRQLLLAISNQLGRKINSVPVLVIDKNMHIGFNEQIAKEIQSEIERCSKQECFDVLEQTVNIKQNLPKLTIPIVISAAAVDAINPCAFAVIIILMAAALSIADKKRALKFGLAFSLAIYISYFLIGLGLFSAIQMTGVSQGFYAFVIGLAIIVGALNIRDYFRYCPSCAMEVPVSWRPKMKSYLKSATTPLSAFLIGFVVSLFELPCTGGPYFVILGMLAKEVTRDVGILYLLLYNLIFTFPLILLTLIIYKGYSTTHKLEKLRQKRIRQLHLIAGILMFIVAFLMLVTMVY